MVPDRSELETEAAGLPYDNLTTTGAEASGKRGRFEPAKTPEFTGESHYFFGFLEARGLAPFLLRM